MTPAFRRAWQGATWLLVLLIVVLSLVPQELTPQDAGSDKLHHAVAYFALTLMAAGLAEPGSLWRIAGGCLLLGAVLELLQGALTADRTADWGDFAANAGGIGAACLLLARLGAGWARHVAGWLTRRRSP